MECATVRDVVDYHWVTADGETEARARTRTGLSIFTERSAYGRLKAQQTHLWE